MTPPPSSQIPKPTEKAARIGLDSQMSASLVSPPATLKTGPQLERPQLFGEVPSQDSIEAFNEDQLRGFVNSLVPALAEARMSAAHAKLQHSLLSIETAEAAKRFEVEHEMARREVQVLQEGSQIFRGGLGISMSPRSPNNASQRHLENALKHCHGLQAENDNLKHRLRGAKKLIAQLDEENTGNLEKIAMLRQRIKSNRDHLNAMRASGAISIAGTPTSHYSTPLPKAMPRTPATTRSTQAINPPTSHTEFDTLIKASQVLDDREANSVPSTPTPARPRKQPTSHVRGAHSLSSLPSTPNRSRPLTADNAMLTPGARTLNDGRMSILGPNTQLTYTTGDRRHDRDSTISVSDAEEEAYTDEDVPASQASQRAINMLRRSQESVLSPGETKHEKANMSQGKLYGKVKKPGLEGQKVKRGADDNRYDEIVKSSKRARREEGVGLGIKSLESPG